MNLQKAVLMRLEKSSLFTTTQIVRRASLILEKRDRIKAGLIIVINLALGILDVLAVLVFGLIGSLAVSGVSSKGPGDRVRTVLEFLGIQNLDLQSQVTILGLLASTLLIFKSFISYYLSKKTLFFLSRRGAIISSRLIARLLGRNILVLRSRTIQETIFAVTAGVQSVTLAILGAALLLVSDIFLIVAFSASLFLVDTLVAVLSLILFSTVGILIYIVLHKRAQTLGAKATNLEIKSSDTILQVVSCYRELVVKNRRQYFAQQIGGMRIGIAEASANLSLMGLLSKYVIEITMVIGALVIGAAQFVTQPATRAVAVISIFLISSARIAPAVLRVQTGLVSIRANIGGAQPTLTLIEESLKSGEDEQIESALQSIYSFDHSGFCADVLVEDLSFQYPGQTNATLQRVSFSLKQGKFLGIVGPSGAGKSTLVDLILGILEPSTGRVRISGLSPRDAIQSWTGAIAYVPQEVSIFNGSIKENVCLGFECEDIPDKLIIELLNVVGLEEFVDLPGGIHSSAGERGSKMSGGQRQRLGIARALFTQPKLLVLDEATSSLDAHTEKNLATYLSSLKGSLSLIVVAHRLSTVMDADQLIYIDDGTIVGSGTFSQLRIIVPDFDSQARIMGL